MAIDSKRPEERFLELGESLTSQRSSQPAEELYSLLDAIDGHLSRVEQSPSQSMLDALQPTMRALARKEFLRHSDMDVKVAVASCISEITRITAPEAPYDDDIMKEIFQMIVAAFEGLDDMSCRSFQKRVSILETVAKVRSCVVMLDLECDDLILQMFHHFLKTIRADHSENIFSSMEIIMSLVLEESEEISSDLLSCLLDSLKNENKEVLPVAQKLAEKVISTCASKIKPYLVELVQSTGVPLSKYSKIVASICQENSDALDHNETHVSGEIQADDSKLSERTVSDELPQVSAKLEEEVGCPEKVGAASDIIPIEATSNGTILLGNGDSMQQSSFLKQTSESLRNGQSEAAVSDQDQGDKCIEAIAVKPDGTEDLKKEKGQNPDSLVQSMDTADDFQIDSNKDALMVTRRRKGRTKEADSRVERPAREVEPAVSPEHKKNNEPLRGPDNPTSIASPPPIESPQSSVRTKRGRPPGPKVAAKHTDVDTVAALPTSASVEKDLAGNSETLIELTSGNDSEKEPKDADNVEAPTNSTNDSEVMPRKNTGKKGRFKRKAAEQESSARKQKSNTRQPKGEGTHVKDEDGEPSLKEMATPLRSTSKALRSTSKADQSHLDDCVKPKTGRKRPLERDIPQTSDHKRDSNEQLVGSKIKVWWPEDKMFYAGVVDSYDPATKKHKIVYADGDIEVLLLKKEHWKHVKSGSEKDGGKRTAEGSASQMSRSKRARASSNTGLKQAKSPQQSKSGTESSNKDDLKPRGRPRSGASNLGKLSYDEGAGTSKKSIGFSSNDKARTPRSRRKLNDEPENESEDGTPRTISKQEESASKSKDGTSKGSNSKIGNVKDEAPKSGRKSKGKTPNASTKVKDDISRGSSKVGDDSSKSKDSTPKTAIRSEVGEVSMNKGLNTKPRTNNTPKSGGDSEANSMSGKGKAKDRKSGAAPYVSESEAIKTGGRKRKRKGRK